MNASGEYSVYELIQQSYETLHSALKRESSKAILLALLFLRYVSGQFERKNSAYHTLAEAGATQSALHEVFYVPRQARWSYIVERKDEAEIGAIILGAFRVLERMNPLLCGLLPELHCLTKVDHRIIQKVVTDTNNIGMDYFPIRNMDVVEETYQIFDQYAVNDKAVLRKTGSFYTPHAIAALIVGVLNPQDGKVLDPCCGTGSLLLESLRRAKHKNISIELFGIDNDEQACVLAKMNAYLGAGNFHIENRDASMENNYNTFDYIMINPPFQKMGGGYLESKILENAMLSLKPGGKCACIVPNGVLSRNNRVDIGLRKKLIADYDLETIIQLNQAEFSPYARVNTSILFFSRRRPSQCYKVVDLRQHPVSPQNIAEIVSLVNGEESLHYTGPIPVEVIDKSSVDKRYYQMLGKPQKVSRHLHDKPEMLAADKIFRQMFGNCEATKKGSELFTLCNGKDKKPSVYPPGPYLLFKGNGLCGTCNECNLSGPLPTLVINRVGDNCGRVHLAQHESYVTGNAMFISQFKLELDIIFLLFAFRHADINNLKVGGCQPFIRQDDIYNADFLVPPIEAQKQFHDQIIKLKLDL